MNNVDLMCLFWTTAGVFPKGMEISRFDFKDRVAAAAKAGFQGVGIWHTDLEHTLTRYSFKDMKRILDDNGMKYLELEFLIDWFIDGPRRAESDRIRRLLVEASAALGAKHIKVGDFSNTPCPMPKLVEAFSALCEEARQYGATIGYELMASSRIDNFPEALALVEQTAAPNGGLVLDIVHVVNIGITGEQIARIPLQKLICVELNDNTLPGSPNADPSRARRWCGEGEYDIRGFIGTVQKMGYTGPWAVEVMSEELAILPLEEQARLAYQTTIAEFGGA